MNQPAANPAAILVNNHGMVVEVVVDTVVAEIAIAVTVESARCFLPFVPHVVRKPRFLLNRIQPSQFIAEIVLKNLDHKKVRSRNHVITR